VRGERQLGGAKTSKRAGGRVLDLEPRESSTYRVSRLPPSSRVGERAARKRHHSIGDREGKGLGEGWGECAGAGVHASSMQRRKDRDMRKTEVIEGIVEGAERTVSEERVEASKCGRGVC